jgi:hypothetical protein
MKERIQPWKMIGHYYRSWHCRMEHMRESPLFLMLLLASGKES